MLSAHNKQWKLHQPAPPEFMNAVPGSDILATLLYQRGVQDPENVTNFLHDDYPHGLHDPSTMKGMPEASKRIAHAIAEQEPIVVYGDYDTDGITSTSLLYHALTAMGATVQAYIPHREREGYGLNIQAIEHLANQGIRILITVDCGISNSDEVARANALGLDVIVTDHHTPPATLPPALAIVNPKQPGCPYPYKQLAGVGIAFKLVQSLVKYGLRASLRGRDMLELVALGTVADIAPLNGENRILVKAGIKAINMTERPGLRALLKAAGIGEQSIDSRTIGFWLAPRLNAAGRMDDAREAYDLLLAEDPVQAEQLASELNKKNRQRQIITEEIQTIVRNEVEGHHKHLQKLIVFAGEGFPSGIVGLVAGKLVAEWSRPVVLLARGETESVGSARSVTGFNIIEALTSCSDLFEHFGGHSMAAGLTIKNVRLPELEQRLLALAEQNLTDAMLIPTLDIDVAVGMHDITWDMFHQLESLEPFGSENHQPVFMSHAVQVSDIRSIGSQGQHLKFRVRTHGTQPLDAIAFKLGHLAEPLQKHPTIDIAYTLECQEWNNQRSLQLNIKDFRRSTKDLS